MNPRRVIAVTKKNLLRFKHDRRTLAFVILVPLIMMLIFGYTFGGEAKHVRVYIVNMDEGIALSGTSVMLSEALISNLNTEALDINTTSDISEAEQKVADGKAWGAIIFPPNFSSDLFQHVQASGQGTGPVEINIILDNSNSTLGSTVVRSVNEAIIATADEMSQIYGLSKAETPVKTDIVYKYGSKDLKFIDYFAPGVMGFAIMMITVMITIVTFVEERRSNTLERLLSSPLTEGELVLGTAAAFAILAVVESGVLVATALLVFHIHIVGGISQGFLALFFIIMLAVGHLGLGLLLSTWARKELQAVQFMPLILFPSILLSGLFWPIESIPAALQPVSHFIPLTYGIDALRSIMLRGWCLNNHTILLDLGVLLLFAAITLGLSVIMLKRRK